MKLVWSNLAKQELLELENWGREVAVRYLEDMHDATKRVATNPGRAKALKGPLRILRVQSHCLIVHVDESAGRVTIARIPHAAMDLDRHLP